MSSVAELAARFQMLQHSDYERSKLVKDILEELTKVQEENEANKHRIELYQFNERCFAKHIRETGRPTVNSTSPFVLVLIDGDSALFQDSFVTKGAEGGHKAAQHLVSKVDRYVREKCNIDHGKIFVNIFCNYTGLVEAYAKAGIVADGQVVRRFISGFNRELPLAAYIDAGADKDAADNKVKAMFDLFWKNNDCKHILLAASSDQGYVNHLRQYSNENESRLTLIESITFPWPLRELAARFSTTKFPDIFREDKIVVTVKRELSPVTPPTPISWAHAASERSSENSDPGWSIVGKKAVVKKQKELWVNRYGQRIDLPLEPWDQTTEKYLEDRAICQKYVLGTCDNKRSCKFKHDDTLSAAEKLTLARIARKSKCMSGLLCMDINCPFGHQCYYGKDCAFGSKCRFDETDMHNFDKVKKTRIQ